jgi:AraC family transcriptional regulator, regulatory protein of adaptative response / methylated-DNA-[protein]-cysteine methyltransferase
MTRRTRDFEKDYQRVSEALAFLELQAGAQPRLSEVAAHVGLSEHHFQRLFKRFAGVSPKRFLQFLTLAHAKRVLRDSASVLDASYSVGLSGPSRLHDLFVSVEAMTPGDFKSKGEGLSIRTGFSPSPFGECLVGVTDRGICWLSFADERTSARESLQARYPNAQLVNDAAAAEAACESAFTTANPTQLCVRGTNFELQVWRALLRIPLGARVSYSSVARALGRPKASRAVGRAVGANPVAFLIPCHRVIRASGAFQGYRWGDRRKQALLGWEAAQTDSDGVGL